MIYPVKFYPHENIDPIQWNNFVTLSKDAWLFHTHEWQKLLKEAWPSIVYSFGIIDNHQNLVAIFPLTIITPASILDSAFGVGGIAFKSDTTCVEKYELFEICMNVIKQLMKRTSRQYFKVPLPVVSNNNIKFNFEQIYLPYGFKDVSTQTYVIDLRLENPDNIFNNFSKTVRYDIRNAIKRKIRIKEAMSIKDVDIYYKLHHETYTRTDTKPHPKAYFEKIWEYFGKNGTAKMFLAELDGKIVAADNIGIFKKKAFYWTGASSIEGLKSNANKLIQWHAIKWCIENDIDFYESGEAFPTAEKGSKLAGLTFFKKNFGGKLWPFYKVLYVLG